MIITATIIINITILTTLLKIIAAKFNSNDMTMIVIIIIITIIVIIKKQ
jgi:hypothetical protein